MKIIENNEGIKKMQELQKYDAVTDRYNQTRCGICWGNYNEEPDEITKVRLVCDHIFHRDCVANMNKCPLCLKSIEAILSYNQSDLEREVNQLFVNMLRVASNFPRQVMGYDTPPWFDQDKYFISRMEQFLENNPDLNQFLNPYGILRNFNTDISRLLDEIEEGAYFSMDAITTRHAAAIVEFLINCLDELSPIRGNPADIVEIVDVFAFHKGVKKLLSSQWFTIPFAVQNFKNDRLRGIYQYAVCLEEKIVTSPRLIEFFEQRKIRFTALKKEDLCYIPADKRVEHLRLFEDRQLELLIQTNDPSLMRDSKEALMINKNFAAFLKKLSLLCFMIAMNLLVIENLIIFE